MLSLRSNPRMRRLAAQVLVSAMLLGTVGVVAVERPAAADSVDDAKRKVREMADQLEAAEAEADRLSEELRIAEDDKMQLEIGIAQTEADIAVKQTELGGLQTEMSDLAIEAFVGGGRGGSITGLLAPGGGPNESVQKQSLTEIALNVGFATSDELDSVITDLGQLTEQLTKQKNKAEDLAESIIGLQEKTDQEISQYTELKAKAETELGSALAAERARRAAAAAAAARAQAAALVASRGNGIPNSPGEASKKVFDPSTIPSTSSRAAIAVAAAKSQVGVPYVKYMSKEGVGFDCSGLTMYAWKQAGVSLPHQSRAQFARGPQIPTEYIEPGDLVYFHSPISHVGIYIGGGMMVDAPGVGRNLRIAAVTWSKVVGVTRPG
jgi:cell wall-associated NlpC family hydrolase